MGGRRGLMNAVYILAKWDGPDCRDFSRVVYPTKEAADEALVEIARKYREWGRRDASDWEVEEMEMAQ
jgi:hypothetical protein